MLIGDSSVEFLSKKYDNVDFYPIEKVQKDVDDKFKSCFVNFSPNSKEYEYLCFSRVFILHQIMKNLGIEKIFHIDSDNILLKNINLYPFDPEAEAAYIFNNNFENELRMSNSIHCGLLSRKFCEVFENLYKDVYINKSKFHLIQDKIDFHKQVSFANGGICDMTFYYLIQHLNLIKVQNLSQPQTLIGADGVEKCIFINRANSLEGFSSRTQYRGSNSIGNKEGISFVDVQKVNTKGPFIFDILKNESYILFNLHFQGHSKSILNQHAFFFESLVTE